MQTKIKICGIQNLKTALFCEKIGVDLIGFNFVKTSKRYIDPENVLQITKKLQKIAKVGLFVDENIEKVNEIAETLDLDFLQLHGNEDLHFIEKCIKPVIKAFRVSDDFNQEILNSFDSKNIKYFLFDGLKNGQKFDHKILNTLKISKPYFIAGGLNESNIANIIEEYKPFGVDIASGVEDRNGDKDLEKIEKINHILKRFSLP